MVNAWDAADDARRIGSRPHTVGEHFAVEQPQLAPLPGEAFETGTWLTHRVDGSARSPSARTATPCRFVWSAGRSESSCTNLTSSSMTAAPRWHGTNG
jgi:hypothetical protein